MSVLQREPMLLYRSEITESPRDMCHLGSGREKDNIFVVVVLKDDGKIRKDGPSVSVLRTQTSPRNPHICHGCKEEVPDAHVQF